MTCPVVTRLLPLCELSTFRALTRVLSPSFSRAEPSRTRTRKPRYPTSPDRKTPGQLLFIFKRATRRHWRYEPRGPEREAQCAPATGAEGARGHPARKKLTSRGRGAVPLFLRGQRGRPDPVVGETSHRIADNCAVVVKAWDSCFSARSIMAADPPRARRSRRQTQSFRVGRQWTTPALS